MKFSCTQENLNRGLQNLIHLTSKNVNLPILHNVLIETRESGIDLIATNLEVGLRIHLRGKIEESGSFTVPANLLANYVGLLSAERVDVFLEEPNMIISAGNQQTKIKGEKSSEFPIVPEVEKNNRVLIPIKELKTAIKQSVISASHDIARPEISGVLFYLKNRLVTIAATDSYRLTECIINLTEEITEEKKVIIPTPTLGELSRIFPETDAEDSVEIYFGDGQILFQTKEFKMTSRLIEGQFPDYKQIIPKQERTVVVVDKVAFIKAIKAASLFSKSGIHDVNMHFSPEKQTITLTTVNNQIGENTTKIEAEIVGDSSNSSVLNYRYLLEGLSNIPTQKVRMYLADSTTPVVFQPHGDKDLRKTYTYIVMPIKQ
ncbi:MAG: DNA polymerase III subunit beta [Candidatus Kerfeldbacteria bacterium RIFOXYA2_FULL_38_24]|uniref:Beta sliding clamp n=1 Tax=Candidatus Kerfeldbacteria bacterium RIFOXYB2_FULL_38_14 TaxID=1798547 RepID=A0A1G2BHP5_9BACT|nr:MAG: DNA polymerase III subunit beta [Candidatus Kerfeldbacteria bacterium RIFOXYB2_FULL_38_14]OGY88188.1 MAG: DNA polymerase III subunit beta [Candidatus Kerfeldbacteria bacterium RIFOXYA2_FULL_38_24]OGY89208.1 MAG: DNA polymerase III subunit beta [Candidatus Kerfeldbacteria bacterium RIFOXYC2_FULL_38_9]